MTAPTATRSLDDDLAAFWRGLEARDRDTATPDRGMGHRRFASRKRARRIRRNR